MTKKGAKGQVCRSPLHPLRVGIWWECSPALAYQGLVWPCLAPPGLASPRLAPPRPASPSLAQPRPAWPFPSPFPSLDGLITALFLLPLLQGPTCDAYVQDCPLPALSGKAGLRVWHDGLGVGVGSGWWGVGAGRGGWRAVLWTFQVVLMGLGWGGVAGGDKTCWQLGSCFPALWLISKHPACSHPHCRRAP